MVIQIQMLTMRNFKGVLGERKIEFSPTVTQVLGANKTGKTTIADAFRWCLFGKNSEGKSEFGIKTKDEEGNVLPELSHEVEVALLVDDKEVVLKRVYVEKWTKPRQQEERKLTGHTTNYFVNGDKYTEKDYKAYIDSICSESLFVCITNPNYFTSLPDDKQRALLTKMVGEVSLESIADGNEAFTNLLKEIDGEELVTFLQHLSYKKKEVKEELERIPVRISEQKNEIATLTDEGCNWVQLEKDIASTEQAIERIDEEIADRSKVIDSEYNARRDERKAVNDLREKADNIEFKHRKEFNAETNERQNTISTLESKLRNLRNQIAQEKDSKEKAQAQLKAIESEKEDFRNRWQELDSSNFVANEDELVCPTCLRRYEQGKVDVMLAEMERAFNTQKASKLEAMEQEAADIKQRTKKLNERIEEADAKQLELRQNESELKQELEKAKAVTVLTAAERIENDAELRALREEAEARIQKLNKPDTDATQEASKMSESLKKDKEELRAKRDALRDKLNTRTIIANKNKRIAELERQEKKLNEQLAELERQEYTAEEFVKANIEVLEQRVNSLFSFVQFTMFDHRLNGALKPMCECTVMGVPYSDLNNADRINAGIDIINAICNFNNVYAPCFIDNAESINDVMPMQSQCIQLIVSRDKQLVTIHNNND